jgi:hypothetical protein
VIKSHKEAERLAAVVSSKDAELASLREALARERAEKERLRAQFEKAQLVRIDLPFCFELPVRLPVKVLPSTNTSLQVLPGPQADAHIAHHAHHSTPAACVQPQGVRVA